MVFWGWVEGRTCVWTPVTGTGSGTHSSGARWSFSRSGSFLPASALASFAGAVLSIKENVYIEAARALGASNTRIMLRYVLPNIMPVVIILSSVNLGAAVLAEATVSFLGFGIPRPFPTWGQLLSTDGRIDGVGHEWLSIIPGAAIFICVFGFNMLGDALRDVLDPRLRGSR